MAHKQRSKSTSSIPTEQDEQRKVRHEELQIISDQVKETEAQWRHDLARWKSHRWNARSNMVREREEHERAELAGGAGGRKPDTPTEMQGGESRAAGAEASHRAESSSHTPRAITPKLQPRSISLPPRSYAADGPYVPSERAVTPPTAPYYAQTRTGRGSSLGTSSRSSIARTDPSLGGRTCSAPNVPIGVNRAGTRLTGQTSGAFSLPDPLGGFPGGTVGAGSVYRAPNPGRPAGRPVRGKSPGLLESPHSMDAKPAAAQVTASLPRSRRRADSSSRLVSVVSPRPFGTQSSRISPVAPVFAMDNSHRCFNGEKNLSQNSTDQEQQSLFHTPEDEARSEPGSILRSNKDRQEDPGSTPIRGPPAARQTSSHCKLASESPYVDITIRLNQRTNSSQDFGFQTSWQSTGIFIKSIQQGSPAELCQLLVGDEIVAVDGRRASEMSCEQWKASLDSASQQGSLVLDVRRNGQNGSPEKYISASNEFISRPPLEAAEKSSHTFNSQATTDLESKGMNGGLRPETMESQESESLSLKNLKRRSEFFEHQGGSESAISDLRIPSITTSSTRRSWDPKEERKRQEKWQQEQERLLQEKYKRDQQKLEEEWRRAQQDAVQEGSGNYAEKHLEVHMRSLSPVSPTSPLSQATPPPLEEPSSLEDGNEPEVTPPQGESPDKKEEETKGEEEELGLQRNYEEAGQQPRPEEEEERNMCQQAADTCFREKEGNQQEPVGLRKGDGLAKIHLEISVSDRAKSKSTPELDEVDKPEVRVVSSSDVSKPTAAASQEAQKQKKKKKSRPVSQVEMDRLQILEEMKKKTQLLTDTSWIRQRSTNVYKEPIHLGGGMRRYESLDNLNTARSWRQSPWPPSPAPTTSSSDRPQSAVSNSASSHSYTRSYSSTLPTSFSMGSLRPSPTSPTPPTALNEESSPEPEFRPPSQRSSASTASLTSGDLELEPELKSDCETGNSSATPATPDSQMDCPSPCDLTTLLAEEETTDNKNG